jgi:hypothetical protein
VLQELLKRAGKESAEDERAPGRGIGQGSRVPETEVSRVAESLLLVAHITGSHPRRGSC